MHAPRSSSRWTGRTAALAAAIAILAVGVTLVLRPSAAVQPFRDIASAPTGRTRVTLRDGTQLTLGPATHLRVPNDFGRGVRAVELDGEAYFNVVHNVQHPFMVQTHTATVTDVGTEFDVRAYADDHATRVAVVRGAASVGPRVPRVGQSMAPVLYSGQLAEVTETSMTVTQSTDVAALTAWMQGRLVFERTPLREVVREISTMFNLQVTVPDTVLAKQLVTASFTDQPADVVLADVTAVLGADFKQTGRTVVIRPRPASVPRSSAHPRPLSTAINTPNHSVTDRESHE